MASIVRRGEKWRARFRDDAGKEHARHFTRKVDAQRWVDEQTARLVRGEFVDPRAGRTTFREYAEQWRVQQLHHRESTRRQCESRLRLHVYPVIGDRPLTSLRRSDVQEVVTRAAEKLKPATVKVVHAYVSAVLTSAVQDRLIASSPVVRIKLPSEPATRVVPLTVEEVAAIAATITARYRAMVLLAAATGLRSGELRGLTLDRITPALHVRGELPVREATLRVDRQLSSVSAGEPTYGPPKSPAADRRVKVGPGVVQVLQEHLEAYGGNGHGLLFTTSTGAPVSRSIAGEAWRAATRGLDLPERSGWHELRHFHASLLIADGRSPRAVADRLGHEDPAETLRTYAHLWPSDEERAVAATEVVLASLA